MSETMSEAINIYTDGACTNNPGPGGWAAIILTLQGTNLTVRGRDPSSTNNRMDLTAAVNGLHQLDHLIPQPWDVPVIVHSNSKYLTNAFNENWLDKWQKNGWSTSLGKPVSNRDLWDELLPLAKQRNITWQWVKGHSGNHFNELCDQMATEEAQMAAEEAQTAAEKAETAARQAAPRPHETPDDFQIGSGHELGPVQPGQPGQPGQMEILDLIFRIADKANSFKHFKQQMGRLGAEHQLGTIPRELLMPSARREHPAPLDYWSHPEGNERNEPPSKSEE